MPSVRSFDCDAVVVGGGMAGLSAARELGSDPWSRGAYSYVAVGGEQAPLELQKPESETLFLAGEYTETEDSGTVAAALRSGQRAARLVCRALG